LVAVLCEALVVVLVVLVLVGMYIILLAPMFLPFRRALLILVFFVLAVVDQEETISLQTVKVALAAAVGV
jgi:hypothetical protein